MVITFYRVRGILATQAVLGTKTSFSLCSSLFSILGGGRSTDQIGTSLVKAKIFLFNRFK